jgi:hypothetical protein
MKSMISRAAHLPGLLLASLAVFGGACHEHAAGGDAADDYFYSCEDAPTGVSVFATDESYRAIADKESAGEVERKDAESARLGSPASGATISIAMPPTFVIAAPMARLAPAAPSALPPRSVRKSPWRRVVTWLAPIGTAYAHCPGVTGDNFLLRLNQGDEPRPIYSALVSVTSFTPRAASWSRAMKGRAGQTVTVSLVRAGFTGGRVTSGPFVGSAAMTLNVGP